MPSRTNKAPTRTATTTGIVVKRNLSHNAGRRSHSRRRLNECITSKLFAVCRLRKREILWFYTLLAGRRSRRYQAMKSSFLTQLSKAAKLSLHALFADRVWIHICNGVYLKGVQKQKTCSCFAPGLIFNRRKCDIISFSNQRKKIQ